MLPLVKKYEPKTFDDLVGISFLDKLVEAIKTPDSLPNMLFYGEPGTGKTSLVNVMLNELKPVDVLKINGSDERGIDTVREKITDFVSAGSMISDKPKIVFIDEIDGFTKDAFQSMRRLIEQSVKNARFIATCNNYVALPEAILSRFGCQFKFEQLQDEHIMNRLTTICQKENINIVEDTLITITKSSRGDLRQAINKLQLSSDDELTDITTEISYVYNLLLQNEWTKLRYKIPLKNLNYIELFVGLEQKFFESDIEVSKKAEITEIISNGLCEYKDSFNKNIWFGAVCSRIIKKL